MDYTAKYGLEFNPFLKNSKEVLVETREYKEGLFRLNYLLTTKGFGLLTGSAGRGKTTAVRNWSAGLNHSLYKVVYSSLSTLTVNDFYRNLAAQLGAQPAFRKTDNFQIIQNEINRFVLEKRQTPVIIIDKANYIGNAVLNDLKMLFNFEMDSRDRAVVLLSGLPQLNSTLRLSIHEPFRQRIVMNYNLEGMTKAEGHSYVAAKLKGIRGDRPGTGPKERHSSESIGTQPGATSGFLQHTVGEVTAKIYGTAGLQQWVLHQAVQ